MKSGSTIPAALTLLVFAVPPAAATDPAADGAPVGRADSCPLADGVDFSKVLILRELRAKTLPVKGSRLRSPRPDAAPPRVLSDVGRVQVDWKNVLLLDLSLDCREKVQQLGITRLSVLAEIRLPLLESGRQTEFGWDLTDSQVTVWGSPLQFSPFSLGLRRGDELELAATVTACRLPKCPEPRDGEGPPGRTAKILVEISDFGLTERQSDNVLFVRSSQSRKWDPRPGASATFGYRLRRDSRVARFWNFLGPDIGLNVALLDFNKDEDIEVGLGIVSSLFNGALYYGGGWNLTTDFAKKRYIFIGISIIDLQRLSARRRESLF